MSENTPIFIMRKYWGTYAPHIKCFIKIPWNKELIKVKNTIGDQFRNFDDLIDVFYDYNLFQYWKRLMIKHNNNDLPLIDDNWRNWWGKYSLSEKQNFKEKYYLK